MWLNKERAQKRYPHANFYGNKFFIAISAKLGNNCRITHRAQVLAGVTIGEGARVLHGATIRNNIKAYARAL